MILYTNSLKNKKAPRVDRIPPIAFFRFITKIFNWYLSNGYFPKHFKKSLVIQILKLGKTKNSPSSYRPISMLNAIDKVFEEIKSLLKRTTNNLISGKTPEQFTN